MNTTGDSSKRAPGAATPNFELQVDSDPANLAPARIAAEKFAADLGLNESGQADVGLCLNEAMANVTRHAYHGAVDRPILIKAWKADGFLVITLRDWGDGRLPPPEHAHDPLKPGGLGLHCLSMLMSDVHFSPQPDGMLLTMKRKLS